MCSISPIVAVTKTEMSFFAPAPAPAYIYATEAMYELNGVKYVFKVGRTTDLDVVLSKVKSSYNTRMCFIKEVPSSIVNSIKNEIVFRLSRTTKALFDVDSFEVSARDGVPIVKRVVDEALASVKSFTPLTKRDMCASEELSFTHSYAVLGTSKPQLGEDYWMHEFERIAKGGKCVSGCLCGAW